jgi:hypothetical protein
MSSSLAAPGAETVGIATSCSTISTRDEELLSTPAFGIVEESLLLLRVCGCVESTDVVSSPGDELAGEISSLQATTTTEIVKIAKA